MTRVSSGQAESLEAARTRMVQQQIASRGLRDRELLRAFGAVPRHLFVESGSPYADEALPLAAGQTISQPYIVARMTQALALGDWSAAHGGAWPKVLDVGTGSGYQAAILAALGAEVVSVELEAELAEKARLRLLGLGYHVKVVAGDGSRGVPDEAPFAAIVVMALPRALRAIGVMRRPRPDAAPAGYVGWPLWYHRVCLQHNRLFGWLYIAGLAAGAL